ncbi:MAG TPA: alpha/beta hydrolase [Pseudolabrys sp.]|nr:alpha/beta hydrolase [Pseudolabrys sp.]
MGITSIDVGGITCQYFAVGAGEPIVLLHCTGHSGRQWAELAAALQTDFEVIAPDLCGYGGTAHWPGSGTFNLGVEADLVDALVDKLKRPAHLVGHSFGGAVALQLALRHPNHLKSVTLIEPAAFHLLCDGDDEDKRALRQITEIATTVASAVNCGDYVGAMRRFVDYWTGDGTWDALPNPQRIALASRINKVTLDFWATLNDPTRLGDLVDVDVPALIISGGHSPFPTRRICYHLVRTLPDVKLRTFDDAGHMLPLSHFREIHPLIKAHCDAQHDRKRRVQNDSRARAYA